MTTIYKYTSEGHIEKAVDGTRTILGEVRDVVTKTLLLSTSDEFAEVEADEEITVTPYDEDGTIAAAEAEAEAEATEEARKLTGVEFDGVRCSATKDDQFGLGSILALVQLGYDFNFNFENGNTLNINSENVTAFMTVWVPFRESFF